MEILISQQKGFDVNGVEIKGYLITYINKNNNRTVNDEEFFPDGSDVETKVGQLKNLLKNHFNPQV
jgi:hypothetical protein